MPAPDFQSTPPRHFIYDSDSMLNLAPEPIKFGNLLISGTFYSVLIIFVCGIFALVSQSWLYLIIGFVLGIVAVLVWIISVLWAAGHLRFHVPSSTEAVVQFRNGELSPHQEGSYWLIPGIERVCAFVPTTSIALELFPLEFKTRFLVPLVVRLKFNYKVINSVILVKAIDAHPSHYLLGLPKPLTCKEVEEKIKDQFKSRAKEVIVQAIGDRNADKIREEFAGLKRQIRIDLRSLASSHYGIQVSDFDAEFYIHV